MPINCTDLKTLSESLARSDATEVEIRASISRAYYASFHALMPFVSQLPPSAKAMPASRVSHHEMTARIAEWRTEALHTELGQKKVIKAQIQKALDTARIFRVLADYRLEETISLKDALLQIERARLLMRMVGQIDEMLSGRDEGVCTVV